MNPEPATTPPAGEAAPAPGAPGAPSIARTAVRAAVWVAGGFALGQALRLAGNLVLTRLLFPDVFGLAALVAVIIQGLQMFSDIGIGPAIVQSPRGDDPRFLNTAWTLSCGRGLALWLATWALARPLAAFYGQPLLVDLLPVCGLTAALAGFEGTSMGGAMRHMRAERYVLVELVTQAVTIVACIGLVLLWGRFRSTRELTVVWAVMAGGLLASAVRLALTHLAFPGPRNRFLLDRESLRALLGFGRWVFLSTVLGFLQSQADRLLFAKLVPLELFGVYGVAIALAQLATAVVNRTGSQVLFPAYARVAARGDLQAAYRRARGPMLIVGAAISAGLIACGPPLIALLYDPRYHGAGWMLQLLAVSAWVQVVEATKTAALMALGRVSWVAANNGAKLAGLIVFLPLGMRVAGFPGALAGIVLADLVKYAVSSVAIARQGLGSIRQDLAYTAAVAASAAAAVLVAPAGGTGAQAHLVRLLASGAVAGGVWGAVALVSYRGFRARAAAGTAAKG